MAHASLAELLVLKEGKYMLGKMPYTHFYIFYNGQKEVKREFIKDKHYELQIELMNCKGEYRSERIKAEIASQPSYIAFKNFIQDEKEKENK